MGTTASRILVVEDDRKTAETLRLYLEHAGYAVRVRARGDEGLAEARSWAPDLVILDLLLPGMEGREVCRRLRAASTVPILMVTARTTEEDRIAGLDLGADDYIAKPFSPREVAARVRAVLRRAGAGHEGDDPVLRFDGLTIDTGGRRVQVGGREVTLTPTEFQILCVLARSPGRALTRGQLVQQAFGMHFEGNDRTVDAHVKNLRRKIEPDRSRPSYIATVFGVGYRFEAARDAP